MKNDSQNAGERIPVEEPPPLPPLISFALVALIAVVILFMVPRPARITVEGWRLLTIFVCTVVTLMLRPIPVGAAVLTALTLTVLGRVFTVTQALSGYASNIVWLVMAAFFIARALINSGLARRIALLFVHLLGRTSLGVGYAIVATDTVLAAIIPSNGARVGGCLFPITRSMATVYESYPGRTAGLLGTYLMLTLYNGDVIASAMFLTGQAGNAVSARLAQQTAGVTMDWSGWLYAASVPALAALLIMPWVIYRLSPPEIRHTPRTAMMAREELAKMGPMGRNERTVLVVFVFVCILWATTSLHGVDTTTVALAGVAILLLTGTLSWKQAMQEHAGWDVFVWYGGMMRLGEGLNEFGLTSAFAGWASSHFAGWEWPALTAVLILIYFYIHYAFASMTTHTIALYAPFLSVLMAAGAPAPLVAYSMAFYTDLSASLTHYGTTPAPIIFAGGYVSHGQWWKIGFIVSVANLVIWTSTGILWWKFVGLW